MGKIAKILAKTNFDTEKVIEKNRVCVDLCENIHIHYRNLRLEFGLGEWRDFFEVIYQAWEGINVRADHTWTEGKSHNLAKQWKGYLDTEPKYFPSRLQIELQQNGNYHIHYGNTRLEMKRREFDLFCSALHLAQKAPLDPNKHSLLDFGVTIYAGEKRNFLEGRVYESPFYFSLHNDDPEAYNEYRDSMMKRPWGNCCDWQQYMHLVENLKAGWKVGETISLEPDSLTVRDGHHRMCILLELYGNIHLEVKGNRATPLIGEKHE